MPNFWSALFETFSPDSRFYWPFVIGIGAAFVANVAWYWWRDARETSPAERALKPWVFWINFVVLLWATILAYAKAAPWAHMLSFGVNIAIIVYMYRTYLPPREAAWAAEQRRLKYIPKPKKQRRRR